MKSLRFFILLLLLSAGVAASAQSWQFNPVNATDGLTYNYVTALSLDSFNRLWVGTSNGVNVLSNGIVKPFVPDGLHEDVVPTGRILDIVCSGSHVLVSTSSSLLMYDEASDSFTRIQWEGKDLSPGAMAGGSGAVWIFDTDRNQLLQLDPDTGAITLTRTFFELELSGIRKIVVPSRNRDFILLASASLGVFEYNPQANRLRHIDAIPNQIRPGSLYLDTHDNLWLSPFNAGVQCYDIEDGYTLRRSVTRESSGLSDNDVLGITEIDGHIYISTDGGGINILDPESGTCETIDAPLVLSATTLGKDRDGGLIVGTTHYGVIGVKENFIRTLYDEYMQGTRTQLSHGVVLSMWEDPEYGIWLGTDGGGLDLYDEVKGDVKQIPSTFGRKVNSICPFGNDQLLLMLYNEGPFLFNKRTHALVPFAAVEMPPLDFSLSRTNYLKMIALDNGDILFFNWGENNYRYRRKDHSFLSFTTAPLNDGSVETMSNFRQWKDYTLAVGRRGIYEINNHSLAVRLLYENAAQINAVHYSGEGTVWFADESGIYTFDPRTGARERTSLQTSTVGRISALVVDEVGNPWITVDGNILIQYDVRSRKSRFFSEEDGVEETFFNGRRGTLASSHGNLFFSGASGLMIVNPSHAPVAHPDDGGLRLSLLSVLVDDTPVPDISKKTIRIPNRFGSIRVRISSSHSDPFVVHRFRYQVQGRVEEHLIESRENEFIIQNHAPGRYRLNVSMLTHDGWTDMMPVADFHVLHPFYSRWFMQILYFLAVGLLSFLVSRWRRQRSRIEAAHERQLQEKQQVEEKIRFMSNIAHELRTPLTLIYNPIRRLMEKDSSPEAVQESLGQVSHQIGKMTQMINMVLDVQKMDMTSSTLFIEPLGLNQWIRRMASEFSMELEEKGLNLAFDLDETIGDVNLDRGKVEVALSNLVMNAIKYSDSGTITLRTSLPGKSRVRIAVSDQGRGFTGSPDRLFERFYQENELNSGYGIGLSYTKMLVERHGGSVGAFLNDKVGSTFYFDLPTDLQPEDSLAEYRLPSGPAQGMDLSDADSGDEGFQTNTQTLLVVDNQENILHYIKTEYQSLFKHVYTAENGQEALEIIRYKLPSIVVSDVVMPVMNGFELCKAVKSDLSISHIPVILLTARDELSNQEMGYKLGADAFVPKPFDIKMLYYIIRTQLRNRAEIKRQYASVALPDNTKDITFSLADEKFMIKLNAFIRDNLSDPDLNIDKVADYMCIARSTLFYKMNDLTGMSTGRYIRSLRINRAKELLEKTDESVGEISVKLGFAESRYFSTVFKQETGETPSQYKKRVRSKAPDA